MNNRGVFNKAGMLSLVLSTALLTAFIGLSKAASSQGAPASTNALTNGDLVWYGLYTDAASYAPGDVIEIYASAPDLESVFRLVRLDTEWTEITRTQPITVGPQTSAVGSFIEYPKLSLSGLVSFTLEGWYYPTLLGGDLAVVAGQVGLTEAAAGIIISTTGELGAYVSDSPDFDLAKVALAPKPFTFTTWLDQWYHLALTYDGAEARLYINGIIAASRPQTGTVANVSTPFRLGARAEAPGDLTGIIDGRLDSWAVWPRALAQSEVEDRYDLGLATADPAPGMDEVELYVDFDDAYPSVGDSSHNGYTATITNHGNPGVAGVYTQTGRAIRLNHDQIVDAGWDLTAAITVPAGLDSGMYAVQALTGPDFTPTREGDLLSVRALVIRPAADADRAPIAVMLPTNTWLAYNYWPLFYGGYLGGPGITPRSRYPGGPSMQGGNNSAYSNMGDQVSLALYHGWRRPSFQISPLADNWVPRPDTERAPSSMYLVQWLDEQGFDYDVFSDSDFSEGLISASDYQVLMPHSHHEYWTDGMLASLTQFLNDGGSVAAPAGNIFTWRAVFDDNGVMEVLKSGRQQIIGWADFVSGIDGKYSGTLKQAAACNDSGDDYLALGVEIHLTGPCQNRPFCFGQWEAQNTKHWLWQGSELQDKDYFGIGRPLPAITPTYAVGHEADTWVSGMPIPGLAPGTDAVILAEGTKFDPLGEGDFGGINDLLDHIGEPNECRLDQSAPEEGLVPTSGIQPDPEPRAGTILYFQHAGGGQVLVIGASATPWALESDATLSGLLHRALNCFVFDEGCGYSTFLPAILRRP